LKVCPLLARAFFGPDTQFPDILLTAHPFPLDPSRSLDQQLRSPLIKLTDFGLSRFIDLQAPTLRTRCGSEEYAAPELIMGQAYDGRKTDAWALGVVLFALLTSHLPFFSERTAISHELPAKSASNRLASSTGSTTPDRSSRRSRLMRIAKAEYTFPDDCLLATSAAQAVVDILLVRDPEARARVDDVWELEWMAGTGSPVRKSRLKEDGQDEEQVWVHPFEEELMHAEVEPL
jgi:serine/threonine protein kinase